jgi:flagellar basal body-associated protein FliL
MLIVFMILFMFVCAQMLAMVYFLSKTESRIRVLETEQKKVIAESKANRGMLEVFYSAAEKT